MDTGHHCKLVMKKGTLPTGEFELSENEVVLGRDPSAGYVIPSQAVSRRHARLFRQGERYFLEDLKSSNGTFLNGKQVQGAVPLASGDQIGLGPEITLVFDDPSARSMPTRFSQATLQDLQRTIREEDRPQREASSVPVLVVTVTGLPPQSYPLTRERICLGRAEDNDIVIPSKIVSRYHAVLERSTKGYRLSVLPESTNALLLHGKPLLQSYELKPGDEVRVDSALPGLDVVLAYQPGLKTAETLAAAAQVAAIPVAAAKPAAQASPAGASETMLDAGFGIEELPIPPRLVVTVAGYPPQSYQLLRDKVSLGRADDNDVVIPSRIVSRHHAVLERVPGGYQLTMHPDAINTLAIQGKPVKERYRLTHGDILRIDSEDPGMMVTMTYDSPSEAAAARQAHSISFGDKTLLTIGRDESNDIRLDFPTVSRFHAQLERVGRRSRVTDLHSSNGTFVNDQRIVGQEWLEQEDTIRIGPYRFIVGEEQFVQYDESSGLQVEAIGLNKWVRKNLNILQNISLIYQPREFIVVVGQSGGGKSTLVDAIAGYRPATQGHVFVNGIDVYRNFDAVRNEIGFVPQRDIIHMELTVYQALDYAARLRMPRDTTREERHQRILEVMEELDLTHRKDVQISGLSGGQQKRVSIGVELLTRPGLFFLDEPTSGLDPGTETAFMHLMRRLADQGRTIVMVTHATKNVMLADKVVFLARGGYLAWFGPPDEALEFFDKYRTERERLTRDMEFDQIYAILDDPSKGKAEDWAKRYMEDPAYQKYVVQPLQARSQRLTPIAPIQPAARKSKRNTRVSSLSQFFILSSRNLKILMRDRSSLVLMLLAAPLVGLLDLVIAPLMGKDPFNYTNGDAANGAITLFLLTIYCLLVGGLSQMREIVKEADIYKRERLVNLRILPYVLSKIWVAFLLAFYQAIAYTVLHYIAFKMPGGAQEFLFVYITLALATLTGMVGGILASALAPNASSAPLIMILLIVPLIVLSGALAPVPSTISSIASTRWAFEGLIGITGIGSDVVADPCWKLPEEVRDNMTLDQKEKSGCRCMGISVFDPQSCNFPGIGQYFVDEINQPTPVEPAALADKPPEPSLPPAPDPPADKYNQVQIAQYLDALQSYQKEAERIQTEYKNQMSLYESQAKVYQAEMMDYQKRLAKWEIARNSAVQAAEGTIESIQEQYGWAWVDKKDSPTYHSWLATIWAAQLVISFVYFLLILVLIKRKDVK